MIIYLLTPEYEKVIGKKVKWVKVNNIILTKDQVYQLFYEYSKNPSFIGLLYDSDKKELITYWMLSLQWQIPLIIALSSFIGGIFAGHYLTSSSGTGYFYPYNPPGTSISFIDILKFGAIALIVGFLAWVGAEIYVSIKRGEKPTYPFYPIAEVTRQTVPVITEAIEKFVPSKKE